MNIAATATPLVNGVDSAPLPRDLEGACRALEKAFTQIVFQKMREAMVPESGSGADGFAHASAMSMLDAQWAELSSQGDGMGLWRALYRQLDPDPVKSGAGRPDELIKENLPRREAGEVSQGGVGAPGPRLGHPRSAASVAAYARASRLPVPQSGGAAAIPEEGQSQ